MSETRPVIQHISDTARWAAFYRALETERPDRLFRDEYARRLAGERGAQIAASLPFHQQHAWSWAMRTYLFDRLIREQIADGVDLVVNLAAGLDMRPYRMDLPETLRWVEVDLPGILDYKEEIFGAEKPRCKLERVRMDLAEVEERRQLFGRLGASATRGLVLSEGLIIYLTAQQAGELARDLFDAGAFKRWVMDMASPGLLQVLLENTDAEFDEGVAKLKFAPEDGPDFFKRFGWDAVSVEASAKVAAELKRLPAELEPMIAMMPDDATRMGPIPWAGVCLFRRE